MSHNRSYAGTRRLSAALASGYAASMERKIPFNKPYIAGKELYYIARAVTYGNVSGDGFFTEACRRLFEERFGIHSVMMTTSCTTALEMAALLCGFEPGDEVILPSYTFVSTANAFVRAGAKLRFVDIREDTLNMDVDRVEAALGPTTRAVVPVHYAGFACDMDRIMKLAAAHDLIVVEDAAQGVNAFHGERALGSIGHLGTYSFHETKNYICGEGGALCINDSRFVEPAEILRCKGTNRKQFDRGQVDRYSWVGDGSGYIPSEIACAFLYAQLEEMDRLLRMRREIYERYHSLLSPLARDGRLRLPPPTDNGDLRTNYHMFYVLLADRRERDRLIAWLGERGIQAVFHYVPLHSAPRSAALGYDDVDLPVTDDVSGRLLRLPFYYELTPGDQERIAREIAGFLSRGERA